VPETPKVLETMITALGDLPCTAVVALGGDPGEWAGSRPGNVRLMSFVPQPLLLESADLILTHGGFGSISEAIRTGTPMVHLPMFSDQPHNAARTAHLGLGIQLSTSSPSPRRPSPRTAHRRCRALTATVPRRCPGRPTPAPTSSYSPRT